MNSPKRVDSSRVPTLTPEHVQRLRSKPKTSAFAAETIKATVLYTRSFDENLFLTSEDGRAGFALALYELSPSVPGDESGAFRGARMSAILAAAEAAKVPVFVEVGEYQPDYFEPGVGFWGNVTRASLTQW